MKRLMLLCGLLTAFFLSYAAPIKFLKSIPETGSSINSLDFSLEFDISEALEIAANEKPGIIYGLGYMGSSKLNATLYKGDVETGTVMGQVNTSNFTGKSGGFKDNGNTIQVNFDSTIPIVADQEYTLVITNKFYLYQSGKITKLASTEADYSADPIILKYKGIASEKPQLDVISSSITTDVLDVIGSVEFTLNAPFNINSGAEVLIKEGEDIVARANDLKISSTDNKVLSAIFNDVPLPLGHSYTIELPANSLTHIDDPTVGNFVYKVDVKGSYTYKLAITSSKVDVDNMGIPKSVTFEYDLPEGTTLNGISTSGSRDGFLSIEGNDELTNLNDKCSYLANGKGIKWDLTSVQFEPATKYVFSKKGDTVIVWDAKNANSSIGRLKEYSGEDASVSFTTPSIEDLGIIAPITLGSVKIGRHDDKSSPSFEDGGMYSNIDILEIQRVEYVRNGNTYNPNLSSEQQNAYVYDVTNGTRDLVKEIKIQVGSREDYYEYYTAFILSLKMDFLQDHTYEIVIPKGVLRLTNTPQLYNYITNDEIVYTVKGSTPTEFTVESCSVSDNAEMSYAPAAIVWSIKGSYAMKPGATATVRHNYHGSTISSTNQYPITISQEGWNTFVSVHLANAQTGQLYKLTKNDTYLITIPAGSIVYPGEESLFNPELNITLIGIDEVVPEAEMVNVNLTVNGLHTSSHQSPKGKAYSFNFAPASEWVVESVKHNDKVVANDGEDNYVTEPLTADANITADLKYNGTWGFEDVSTGVWTVENSNIRIYRDGNMIVVEGVDSNNTISVYNVAGMLVGTDHVTDGKDKVYITVPTGQYYIVTVDGVAAKIKM